MSLFPVFWQGTAFFVPVYLFAQSPHGLKSGYAAQRYLRTAAHAQGKHKKTAAQVPPRKEPVRLFCLSLFILFRMLAQCGRTPHQAGQQI
jgi:hypothetical protein